MTNPPAPGPSTGDPLDLRHGGACAWRLPVDETCAAYARARLCAVLDVLGLPPDLVDDAALAVSELATNALLHSARGGTAPARPELWTWARTHPDPQLIVAVFDTDRRNLPRTVAVPTDRRHPPRTAAVPSPSEAARLAEHGRGLGIIAAVAADWGAHPSRSRLDDRRVPGKAVWCALPLPEPWPRDCAMAPAHTAGLLHRLLTHRGLTKILVNNAPGVSLVSLPGDLNVRVEPKSFAFNDTDGLPIRRPLLDFQDLAEHLVRRTEEAARP